MSPTLFTADEKERLFDTLDAIQLDVRKLREGRIRDLSRLSTVEKAVKVLEQAPVSRRERVHQYVVSFSCGAGGLVGGIVLQHIRLP